MSSHLETFDRLGHARLSGFLPEPLAADLVATCEGLDWRLVLNDVGKHFDIHPVQQAALGREKLGMIIGAARQRRHHQFQYLYENYPIFDLLEANQNIPASFQAAYDHLNSSDTLKTVSEITGTDVHFCDMQATSFGPGHFLNRHDDDVAGKNRVAAYTVGLSKGWQEDWGGRLAFLNEAGEETHALVPEFNALSLFRVPVPHEVTEVTAPFGQRRLSLTGWFRTR